MRRIIEIIALTLLAAMLAGCLTADWPVTSDPGADGPVWEEGQ